MMHHTAGGPGTVPSLELVRGGTARLPGPLDQVLVGRDLKVRVVVAGFANHAGHGAYGFVARDHGKDLLGVELEHRGDATESWTGPTMRTSALVAAAILHRLRSQVATLLATDGRNPLMA